MVSSAQLLAEIVERGGGYAVGAHAEVDLVEVELENLVLRIGALDADGEDCFLELAVELLLARQQEVLGHLLGDGGGAFGALLAVVLQVVEHRARDAGEVEAAVLVEALVLGGQERGDHQLGHDVDRHEDAPLAGVFGHQAAVVRVDARHHRRLVFGEAVIVGQIARGLPHEEAGHAGGRHEQHHARRRNAKPSRLKSQLRRRRFFLGAMGGGRIGVGLIAWNSAFVALMSIEPIGQLKHDTRRRTISTECGSMRPRLHRDLRQHA